jgi:TetR/AcrR family transcriptional regulator, regulator of autoinduction and epiphytic fitness
VPHLSKETTVSVQSLETQVDGRVARSERTRKAIAEALLALLEEGVQRPRALEIAKRADVAVRTVFQHFDDMEGLYAEILSHQSERIAPFLAPLDPHRSTADKVRTLVEMRDNMYALAAPLRRGMMRVEAAAKSQTFNLALQELRRAMTQQIQQGFVKELHLNTDPFDVLPRIEAITSFEMWDHFLQVQGASRTAVRLHMAVMVLRELQPTG